MGLNLLSLEPIHQRFGLKTQQLHESGSKSVEFQDTYFGQAEYTIFIDDLISLIRPALHTFIYSFHSL